MKRSIVLLALLGSSALAAPAHAGGVGDFLKNPIGSVFKKIAAKKGDRVFHEKGAAFHATYTVGNEKHPAVVRFSRGRPSAPGKPEILGVAVKIKKAEGDQDVLMVTSRGERGWKSRVLTTRPRFAGQTVSSLLPFIHQGARGPITAQLPSNFSLPVDGTGGPRGKVGFSLNLRDTSLASYVRRGIALAITAGMSNGDFPIGHVDVDLTRPLSAQDSAKLKYNVFNDAEGIKPAGLINGVRKLAYRGSQAGRGVGD